MAIDIDSDAALETLEELFADVQNQLMAQTAPSFAPELVPAFDVLFNTPIQSPREAKSRTKKSTTTRTANIFAPMNRSGLKFLEVAGA